MDIQYLMFLQNLREATSDVFTGFFLHITKFGENYTYFIAFVVFWCVNKKLGSLMLVGGTIANMLTGLVKLTACVYRPWVSHPEIMPTGDAKVTATGYSFPSGHTTQATFSYGLLGYHYRKHKALSACFIIMMVLIMFSRNFIGVHTPQDVIVGFTLTALTLWLLNKLLLWIEGSKNRDLIVVAIGTVFVCLCLIYVTQKPYPLDLLDGKPLVDPKKMMPDAFNQTGAFLGVLYGWIIERRFIEFQTDVPMVERFTRFLSGGFVFVLFSYVGSAVFGLLMGQLLGRFVTSFLLFFYCAAIHPYLFSKFECKKNELKIN